VALINQEGRNNDTEVEQPEEDDSKEKDLSFKRDALSETKRSNLKKEQQKDKEIEIKRKVASRPVATSKK